MVRGVAGASVNRPVPNFTFNPGPTTESKPPISAYARYTLRIREEVKEKYSMASMGDIARKIS